MEILPAEEPGRAEPRRNRRAHGGEVQALVDRLRALEDPRAARLARARRLLLTGGLDAPEVFRETARRMLGLRREV